MAEDGSGIIVLDDTEEREPSEEEIREYAEFLGIDIENEPHLLWIARQSVSAPVPPPWKACSQNGDDVFYFNFETGESLWDHPCDEQFRRMVEEYRAKHLAQLAQGSSSSASQPLDPEESESGDKVSGLKRDSQSEAKALKSLLKDRTKMLQGEEYLRVKTSSVVFREPAVSDCGSEDEADSISVPASEDESLGRSTDQMQEDQMITQEENRPQANVEITEEALSSDQGGGGRAQHDSQLVLAVATTIGAAAAQLSCGRAIPAPELAGPLVTRYKVLAEQVDSLAQVVTVLRDIRAKQNTFLAMAMASG